MDADDTIVPETNESVNFPNVISQLEPLFNCGRISRTLPVFGMNISVDPIPTNSLVLTRNSYFSDALYPDPVLPMATSVRIPVLVTLAVAPAETRG